MAKFIILAATFVVLLTPTIFAKQGPNCEKQIQKLQELFSCQQYLKKSTKMSPSLMTVNQPSSWREEFPRCCEQLEQIDSKCRCQSVIRVLQQLRQESQPGQMQEIEMQEILKTAESLPNLCRLKPQYCRVPTVSY